MKRLTSTIVILTCLAAQGSALAQECSPDVKSAIEGHRKTYVDGMAGVASSNFSSRPGTFSNMACLDQFMKGDLDIFFKPVSLDTLLSQVMSFACEKFEETIGGGGSSSGFDAIGLFTDATKGGSFNVSGAGTSLSVPTVKELFSR